MPHITGDTHPVEVSGMFDAYGVNAVPTFVVIQDNGDFKLRSGWDEDQFNDDLAWLAEA